MDRDDLLAWIDALSWLRESPRDENLPYGEFFEFIGDWFRDLPSVPPPEPEGGLRIGGGPRGPRR